MQSLEETLQSLRFNLLRFSSSILCHPLHFPPFTFSHNLSLLIQLLNYSSIKKPQFQGLPMTKSWSSTVIFFLESLIFSNPKKKNPSVSPKFSLETFKQSSNFLSIKNKNHKFRKFAPKTTVSLEFRTLTPTNERRKLLKDLKTRKTAKHLPYLERWELRDLFQIGISLKHWDSLSCRDRSWRGRADKSPIER